MGTNTDIQGDTAKSGNKVPPPDFNTKKPDEKKVSENSGNSVHDKNGDKMTNPQTNSNEVSRGQSGKDKTV